MNRSSIRNKFHNGGEKLEVIQISPLSQWQLNGF